MYDEGTAVQSCMQLYSNSVSVQPTAGLYPYNHCNFKCIYLVGYVMLHRFNLLESQLDITSGGPYNTKQTSCECTFQSGDVTNRHRQSVHGAHG